MAWAIPIHAASALKQSHHDEAIFIDYTKFRKQLDTSPAVNPQPAPKPKAQAVYSGRHYTKAEVEQLIRDYSLQYGIAPETPLCIAYKESGYNQFSKNKSSSASGVFQYLSSTWQGTDEGKAGLSVFDADANVRAAVKYMAIHRSTRPWVVAPKCTPLKFL